MYEINGETFSESQIKELAALEGLSFCNCHAQIAYISDTSSSASSGFATINPLTTFTILTLTEIVPLC